MPRKISEEITRKQMKVPPLFGGIDPQLEHAGWYLRDHSKVEIEIPACPDDLFRVDGYDAEPWNGVSDYCLCRENGEVLVRQPEFNITQYNYNANQIRFLREVQSVFLQKRDLETADLYDAPSLVGFGQDAGEKWFTEKEVEEVVEFVNKLSV